MVLLLRKCLYIAVGVLIGGNFCFVSAKTSSSESWYSNISIPDSRIVIFYPSEEIAQSETFILKSREKLAYCQTSKKGFKCRDLSPGNLIEKKIRLEIYPARMFPWEYNKFKVILKGKDLSIEQIETSHIWTISRNILGDLTLFVVKPEQKIKMDPDSKGINFEKAEYKNQTLNLNFSDKWSAYYSGKTKFEVLLYKKRFFILKDKKIGAWNFGEMPNKEYELTLSQKNFGVLKKGKYYLKWSFQRLGDNISNSVPVKKGETPVFNIEEN